MSFEERARLSQELRAQEMAKAAQMFKDQLGTMLMGTYYGGCGARAGSRVASSHSLACPGVGDRGGSADAQSGS